MTAVALLALVAALVAVLLYALHRSPTAEEAPR